MARRVLAQRVLRGITFGSPGPRSPAARADRYAYRSSTCGGTSAWPPQAGISTWPRAAVRSRFKISSSVASRACALSSSGRRDQAVARQHLRRKIARRHRRNALQQVRRHGGADAADAVAAVAGAVEQAPADVGAAIDTAVDDAVFAGHRRGLARLRDRAVRGDAEQRSERDPVQRSNHHGILAGHRVQRLRAVNEAAAAPLRSAASTLRAASAPAPTPSGGCAPCAGSSCTAGRRPSRRAGRGSPRRRSCRASSRRGCAAFAHRPAPS